jgi:hypothetical protein
MDCDDEELLIPFLGRADFERARLILDEYCEFEAYEDFQSDREGRVVGLALAGVRARLAPVSFDGFLSWCASAGEQPTSARLDDFAAMVNSFRRNPRAAPRPFIAGGHDSVEAADRPAFNAPLDPLSYRDWLARRGEAPSPALLDAYASLGVEASAKPAGATDLKGPSAPTERPG